MQVRWKQGISAIVVLCGMGAGLRAQQTARESDPGRMVEVPGDHLNQTVRCDGHSVTITGNDSRLSVLGPCAEVRAAGSRNWVTVGSAKVIVATGSQNSVEYAERRTKVSDRGKGNTVAEKYPQ